MTFLFVSALNPARRTVLNGIVGNFVACGFYYFMDSELKACRNDPRSPRWSFVLARNFLTVFMSMRLADRSFRERVKIQQVRRWFF